jgi:hypothetical protein
MSAYGVKAPPMDGDPPPQTVTFASAGGQATRGPYPKNAQDRDRNIQAHQEKRRG